MHLVDYYPDPTTRCHYCNEGGTDSRWSAHTDDEHPMHTMCWKKILAESQHCFACEAPIDVRSMNLREVLDKTFAASIAGSSMAAMLVLFICTLKNNIMGVPTEHLLSNLSRGVPSDFNFVRSTITVTCLIQVLSIGTEFSRALITVKNHEYLHMQGHWGRAGLISYFATYASFFALLPDMMIPITLVASSVMVPAIYFIQSGRLQSALSCLAFSTILLTSVGASYFMAPRDIEKAIWGYAITNAVLMVVTLLPGCRREKQSTAINAVEYIDRYA